MAEPRVVQLTDDIARNLAHLPEEQAVTAIATHLRSFWDPRMLAKLQAVVAADPTAVRPVVAAAVAVLR